MAERTCGTCGWVWERDGQPVSDRENRVALDARLLRMVRDMLGPDMAAHPEDYTPEALQERFDRYLAERGEA